MEVHVVNSSQGAMRSVFGKFRSFQVPPQPYMPVVPDYPVNHQIDCLKQELDELNTLLLDLSKVEAPNLMARHWMNEVRDIFYDIEDYMDIRSFSGASDAILPDKVAEFRTLVRQARQRHKAYELGRWASNPRCLFGQGLVSRLKGEFTDLIGISDPKGKLIEWLTNDAEQKLKVVSVVGPAGVGKTTLAKEVYRQIGGQFECRAFVRASRTPDTRRLLRSMISQIRNNLHLPYTGTVQELLDTLTEQLQHKRYLILIDGLWETTSWDIVNSAFPDGTHCSRILITTDIEEVSLECCDYKSDDTFKMEPLSINNSTELFYNRVFGPKHVSDQLKEVSKEIIRKCGGLPLAVISIASILASQPDSSELWHHVKKCLSSDLRMNLALEDRLREIVGLSYNWLPPRLKICLLYLTMYPEGYTFLKADMVKQWSADGFTNEFAGKDTIEDAELCFDELVCRGLIQPNCIDFSDQVMFYTVHSTVFEVITCKSIEENFTTVIDYSETITKLSAKVRRLSLSFSNAKYATKSEGITLSQVRSLTFYGLVECLPAIMEFKLLRVLILEFWGDQADLDLSRINRLFFLRYMKITTSITVKLPDTIHELQYLETLEMDAKVITVPSDIVHLSGLLHLRLTGEINLPDGIGHMKSLRTLHSFDLSSNSEENVWSLGEMTNLHDLHLTCSTSPSEHLQRNLIALVSSLGKFGNLNSIILDPAPSCRSINLYCSSNVPSPPVSLQRIELFPPICILTRLPIWIGHLQRLRILKIVLRELTSGDIDLIARLQELSILSMYIRQPTAESIIFHRVAFPALRCFKFRCGVQRFVFKAEALPNLRSLKLELNAHRGERYDDMLVGIEHLLNLQEITVRIGATIDGKESDRMAVKSVLQDVVRKHTRVTTVNILSVDSFDEEVPKFGEPPVNCFDSDEALTKRTEVTEVQEAFSLNDEGSICNPVLYTNKFRANVTPNDLTIQLIEHITNYFSDETKIGSGQYGEVYKGVYNGKEIAAKKLYHMTGLNDKAFENTFHNLMKVRHKNIIQSVGYCYETRHGKHVEDRSALLAHDVERVLCYEYMHGGCLDRHIYDESCGPDLQTRLKIIKGTCEGLNFLHNGQKDPIYHLNLKPANILLDKEMVPKIADFGLSRLFASVTYHITKATACTNGYMPPEYIDNRQVSHKFDVFSFGVITLQIIAGPEGYSKSCEMYFQDFVELVLENWNKRLQATSGYTSHGVDCLRVKKHIEIALRCVEADQVKRPTVKEILDELNEVSTEIEKMVQISIKFPNDDQMSQWNSSSAQMSAAEKRRAEWDASGAKRLRLATSSSENNLLSSDNARGYEHTVKRLDELLQAGSSAKLMSSGIGNEVPDCGTSGGGGRRLWVKERDCEWWDRMSSPACPEEEFQRAFRMSRATFEAVCEQLGAAVAKEDTMLRAAIPVRQRVAVCIWRLATGEPLRLVSKRFGLGISTCHNLVLEVCAAIKAVLMPKAVQWPEAPESSADVSAKFEAASGIPNVIGTMYTTHIPIIAPKANVAAYFNRRHTERNQKTSYTVTAQGVVDAAGIFTDVCIGWPGSLSDADVLQRSALCTQRGAAGQLQGQWVVGGAGYPLMDWLLVPYTHQNITWAQHIFNERVDGVRAVARDAFRRLEARWGCLQRRTEVKLQDLPVVTGACFVLHNICERAGDAVDPENNVFELFDDDMVAENPVRSEAAASARDAIAKSLLDNSSTTNLLPEEISEGK